jgi:hypothetical protein
VYTSPTAHWSFRLLYLVLVLAACRNDDESPGTISDDAGPSEGSSGMATATSPNGGGPGDTTTAAAEDGEEPGDTTAGTADSGSESTGVDPPGACQEPVEAPASFGACTLGDPVTIIEGIIGYSPAWNGCEFGVLVRLGDDACSAGPAQFLRVAADGSVLSDPVDVTIADFGFDGANQQLTSASLHSIDGGYLVTSVSGTAADPDNRDFVATQLDLEGSVVGEPRVVFENVAEFAAVHHRFGVTLVATDAGSPSHMRLQTLDTSGEPIGPEVAPVELSGFDQGYGTAMTAIWDGNAPHVVYDGLGDVNYARVSADGDIVASHTLLPQNLAAWIFSSQPALADDGNGGALVAYHDRTSETRSMQMSAVAADGSLGADPWASAPGIYAMAPRVVRGPGENALVWVDGNFAEGSEYTHRFARFTSDGELIDPPARFGDENPYSMCQNRSQRIEPLPDGYGLFYANDMALRHVRVTCEPGA